MHSLFAHIGKLTASLVVLAAGLSWWFAPAPPAAHTAKRPAAPLTLPGEAPVHPEKSVAAIVSANLWGTVQPGAAESLIAPEWRFSGLVENGEEKMVMITVDGQSVRALKVRDQLPGGATILRIANDHLCLLINGRKRKLDLF
jgi:hypothetical protein